MKKLSTFIVALFLIFGMTQCKKQETPDTPNAKYNWVHINMKVNGGERYDIDPNTGTAGFTAGDKIYVSNGGKYRGVLTYSNGAFTGDLAYDDDNPMDTDDYLHFYFFGGSTLNFKPFVDPKPFQTTLNDVDISVQWEKLPVLSYGKSTDLYSNSSATYSSTLENQCALVEFTTNWIPKARGFMINGIKNRVNIDFANHTFTPIYNGYNNITLYPETPTSRWAILLPSEEPVTVTVDAVGYNKINIDIPAIKKNDYLHGEKAVSFKLTYEWASKPLTMMAYEGATIRVINPPDGMKYDIGEGKQTINGESEISIYVSPGNEVRFYGDGTNIKDYSSTNIVSSYNVELSGNIMSLVDEDNFDTITTMVGASFAGLFAGNEFGIDASGLLLPATTLSKNCYSRMFAGCSRMSATPVELPALTLATGCYSYMFEGCSEMPEAPHLPATELVDRCYASMFYQCGTLQNVTCLATTINGTDCTTNWLYEVNFPGTFTKAKGASCWPSGSNGIPWGWTVNEY